MLQAAKTTKILIAEYSIKNHLNNNDIGEARPKASVLALRSAGLSSTLL